MMASTTIYVASQMFNETLPPLIEAELKKRQIDVNIKVIKFEKALVGKVDWRLEVTDGDIENLKDAQILITDNIVIGKLIYRLPNARWIQGTFAGVDIPFNRDLGGDTIKVKGKPTAQVTRFTGDSYGHLMFEYCLSFMIAHERGFLKHQANQKTKDWALMKSVTPSRYRLISELKVTILGLGSIGGVVSSLFKSMGCNNITGYSKSEKDRSYLDSVGVGAFSTDLVTVLTDTDYIISILPDTPSTRELLNYEKLSACKGRSTVLINLGRGSLIKEAELIRSLDDGLLSLAVLDVFEVEPLPVESKLWTHEKVIVTPHISAETRSADLVSVFVNNLIRFNQGQSLDYKVDWDKGY